VEKVRESRVLVRERRVQELSRWYENLEEWFSLMDSQESGDEPEVQELSPELAAMHIITV